MSRLGTESVFGVIEGTEETKFRFRRPELSRIWTRGYVLGMKDQRGEQRSQHSSSKEGREEIEGEVDCISRRKRGLSFFGRREIHNEIWGTTPLTFDASVACAWWR